MQTMNDNLPKGWTITKISELGELIRGVNYKKEHSSSSPKATYLPILRANNIKGKLNFDDLVYVDKKFIEDKQLIKKGDIVFAMSSGSRHLVGKSAKANSDFNGGFGAFCAVFRTEENIVSDFVAYYFQSSFYKEFIRNIASGTNINNLKRDNILGINIPLAPLPEQTRILAKLEQLLTDLDKGIEYLETTKQQLKVYRQAVLKWAFEGKLTRLNHDICDDDDLQDEKTKNHIHHKNQINHSADNAELPKGWQWIQSGELFNFVTSGSRGWAKYYSEKGSIFIRITNLNFDTINLDLTPEKIQYVSPPSNSEGQRTKIQEGDFLFSITGYLGMFAIAPKLESAFVNQHVCLCRPKDFFNKKFVAYWIISKSGAHFYLNKNQKGAVKAGLNLDDLKTFPVPLPKEIKEQELVVQAIESRLSVCDKIEETIEKSLQQADALRLSIIKKAFEGKLLSDAEINECRNDPAWEPAEKLLERIKAFRETQSQPKKGKAAKKEKRKTSKKKVHINVL